MQTNTIKVPSKIIYMSPFLTDLNENSTDVEILDYSIEIDNLIRRWLENVYFKKYKDKIHFAYGKYEFNSIDLENLQEGHSIKDIIKILEFARLNQITLLEESCEKILSMIDFDITSVSTDIAIEIIKYYDTEKIISQPPEILKCFNYNPTEEDEFNSLFNIDECYVAALRKKVNVNDNIKNYLKNNPLKLTVTSNYITFSDIYNGKLINYKRWCRVNSFKEELNYKIEVGKYKFMFTMTDFVNSNFKMLLMNKLRILPKYLFNYEDNLISITLPDSITIIPSKAFYRCYNLKIVNLPKYLRKIGKEAFYGCYKLKTLNLPLEYLKSNRVRLFGVYGIVDNIKNDNAVIPYEYRKYKKSKLNTITNIDVTLKHGFKHVSEDYFTW